MHVEKLGRELGMGGGREASSLALPLVSTMVSMVAILGRWWRAAREIRA